MKRVKVFAQFDSMRNLIYTNLNKRIVRLNPSILIVSKLQNDFQTTSYVFNKNPTQEYRRIAFKKCFARPKKSDVYRISEGLISYEVEHDYPFKILDITDLDYDWQYFNLRLKEQEYINDIRLEMENVKIKFQIEEPIDGYLVEPNKFMFFEKY